MTCLQLMSILILITKQCTESLHKALLINCFPFLISTHRGDCRVLLGEEIRNFFYPLMCFWHNIEENRMMNMVHTFISLANLIKSHMQSLHQGCCLYLRQLLYFKLFSPLSNVWINRPLMLSSDVTTLKPGSGFDWLMNICIIMYNCMVPEKYPYHPHRTDQIFQWGAGEGGVNIIIIICLIFQQGGGCTIEGSCDA